MARSPEVAAAKDAANAAASANAVDAQAKDEVAKPKLLRGPDGFVYVFTEKLAKEPGFFPYRGEVNKAGFAVDKA
jgi:hypothetical protein